MPFWPQTFKDWVELISIFFGAAAFVGAWYQYRQNSQQERLRWLFELYQKFYEGDSFNDMRIRVEWRDTAFISEDQNRELLLRLDDFLNFFEFVAILKRNKKLNQEEVKQMFDFPLRSIAENQDVMAYLRKYGYEELHALLKEMSYAG